MPARAWPLLLALVLAGCSQKTRVEAVEVVDGGMALRIYVSGTPHRQRDSVEVEEDAREVRIKATVNMPFGGSDDGPEVFWCSEIGLDEPLGDRRIVDANRDEEIERGHRDCEDDGD